MDHKICVVGLGYVGLPLAVAFSGKRTVVGFDVNETKISELQNGVDATKSIQAEQLDQLHSMSFTSDVSNISDATCYVVAVPTPVDDTNRPDLSALKSATKTVGNVLKPGDLVVFESTVYPGCTDEVCIPILEEASGLKINDHFQCGYSPERINPGDPVNRLETVVKIVSGSDDVALERVDALYSSVITAGTYRASSLRVAEAAKIIENTQRDLNIAMVNELSIIFDRIGIDTIEVLDAASTKWNFSRYVPGLVGGHCISVDPYYLTHKAQQTGYIPQVILAGRSINDNMARYAARQVIRMMLKNGIDASKSTVGVFGLTFKENCPDTRDSKVYDLIAELATWNVDVVAVDPHVSADEVASQIDVPLVKADGVAKCDAIILAVPHDEFLNLRPEDFRAMCDSEKPIFADLKARFEKSEMEAIGFSVFRL